MCLFYILFKHESSHAHESVENAHAELGYAFCRYICFKLLNQSDVKNRPLTFFVNEKLREYPR